MRTFILLLIFLNFCLFTSAQFNGGPGRGDFMTEVSGTQLGEGVIAVSGSSGADGTYRSLSGASGAFDAINDHDQTGSDIQITIAGNITTEPGTYSLDQGNWASLIIYPKNENLTVSGTGNILFLNGADNVTLDGRIDATGTDINLTFENIKITGPSANNIIRYINTTADLSVSGSSETTVYGRASVGGDLNISGSSLLTVTPSGTLTVEGECSIQP